MEMSKDNRLLLKLSFISLEAKILQDSLTIDLFLDTHPSDCQHGQTPVAQLLLLHAGEIVGILGLEAKGVKPNVAGVVLIAKGEELSNSRLDPAQGSAEGLDDVDGEEELEKDSRWNLG